MKKSKLLGWVFVALASITSCSDNTEEALTQDNEIRLICEITPSRVTSPDYQSTQIIPGQQVGVTIVGAKSEHKNVAWNVGEEGELSNTGESVYWNNEDLTVTAYHPHNSEWKGTNHEFSVSTNQSDEENYRNSDLLWTTTTASIMDMPVSLAFRHKLAKINIKLVPEKEGTDLNNATISICNTKISATFNPMTGELSDAIGEPQEIEASVTAGNIYTASAIVIPQEVPSGKFIKITHGNKTYYYTLGAAKKIESGHSYQYTLTVTGHEEEIETIPNNQIWYTSSDGNIITPADYGSSFGSGVRLLSNTYKNGRGIMIFSNDVQWISGGSSFPTKAFSGCKTLTSIILPNSVDGIESSAFSDCTSLSSITLPNQLRRIGNKAFSGCTSLKISSFPESLFTIEDQAFYRCTSLEAIVLPNSRQFSIGMNAFGDCSSLKELYISDNVYEIKAGAFNGCNLTSIEVSENNKYFSAIDNVLYNKDQTKLILAAKYYSSIVIPTTVTEICDGAFYGCNLINISIPNTVSSMGERVFYNCKSLKDITFSNSLTTIKANTFYGCSAIENITIPANIKVIKASAFANCVSLKEVNFPNNLEAIEGSAFSGCKSLTAIVLPNNLYSIGNYAFSGCSNLNDINIPDNYISIINEGIFSRCTSLKNITIPSTVNEIGNYAFENCINLNSIYCKANIPPKLSNNAFNYISQNATIYVPAASIEAYQAADYWKDLNIHPNNQ